MGAGVWGLGRSMSKGRATRLSVVKRLLAAPGEQQCKGLWSDGAMVTIRAEGAKQRRQSDGLVRPLTLRDPDWAGQDSQQEGMSCGFGEGNETRRAQSMANSMVDGCEGSRKAVKAVSV